LGENYSLKFKIIRSDTILDFSCDGLSTHQFEKILNNIIEPNIKIIEKGNIQLNKNDNNEELDVNSIINIDELLNEKNNLQEFCEKNGLEKVSEEDKQSVPDFYHTGIKYKGPKQTPHYRTYYQCPRCGNDGRHYIPKDVKFVSCHNCQSKLRVEPATSFGFGLSDKHRDEWGNYFISKMLYIDNEKIHHRLIDE
jgi:hypothetical protein